MDYILRAQGCRNVAGAGRRRHVSLQGGLLGLVVLLSGCASGSGGNSIPRAEAHQSRSISHACADTQPIPSHFTFRSSFWLNLPQLGGGWPERPIQVDATVYASWFGAYTTFSPPHITISTTAAGSQGASGLESLLHEAGHVMLAPLEAAIRTAANQKELVPDPDLGHLVLFYTAGDLVWRAIPDHPTNAVRFGIWSQNRRAQRIRQALAREWRPWLEGLRPMEDALRSLLEARILIQS